MEHTILEGEAREAVLYARPGILCWKGFEYQNLSSLHQMLDKKRNLKAARQELQGFGCRVWRLAPMECAILDGGTREGVLDAHLVSLFGRMNCLLMDVAK